MIVLLFSKLANRRAEIISRYLGMKAIALRLG